MHLKQRPFLLEFRHPFGVAGHSRLSTESVFIQIEAEGQTGYGEACLPAYLGETVKGTQTFLKKAGEFLSHYDPTLPLHFFLDEVDRLGQDNNAAKAALDIALHDLYAKLHHCTYAQMLGLQASDPRPTSFTIAIDHPDKLRQKIEEAGDFSILKIKAGTSNDKELIQQVRAVTNKPICVDVNQGWKDREQALDLLHWFKDQDVLFVEQPLPKDKKQDMAWLTEKSPIPTIADESVKRLADLEQLDGEFSGINIKLMKCTGLREAMRMINFCKKNNILIMLGCMAESSCASTAMAQLMQFADFIDLDAPLLYKNDPFHGISYEKGLVRLPVAQGIGARPLLQLFED